MKFFLPSIEDSKKAEKKYQELKDNFEKDKISNERFYKIHFWDLKEKVQRIIMVGKPLFENEKIVEAILYDESRKLFHVFTKIDDKIKLSFKIDKITTDFIEVEAFK